MNPLSYSEIAQFSKYLNDHLAGAQLQDSWTSADVLVLQFYKEGNFYLCVDLGQGSPYLALLKEAPHKAYGAKKEKKPLGLFLNSNLVNQHLQSSETRADWGRVLKLVFLNENHLELRLIPRAVNALVSANGKTLSWKKPQELGASQASADDSIPELDWWELGQCWAKEKFIGKKSQQGVSEKTTQENSRQKLIEKKTKTIQILQTELAQEEHNPLWMEYKKLGEKLKLRGVSLSDHERQLLDNLKSTKMDAVFQKSKDLFKKLEGKKNRIQILEDEIEKLQAGTAPLVARRAKEGKAAETAQTRKLTLEDGTEVFMGKSGKDNLAILRQAKPWDLWLHLRDYPAAHAIIKKNRNTEISQKQLDQVIPWLCREFFRGKKMDLGQKMEVVMAECRFVKPLKGDSPGRVTYQNAKIYTYASKR